MADLPPPGAPAATSQQPMRSVGPPDGMRRFRTPREMYDCMEQATADLPADACVRNFCAVIECMDRDEIVVDTPLFPVDALAFYTYHNLDGAVALPAELEMEALRARYYDPTRGGAQGDYRLGMRAKMRDVIACLAQHPGSKRAVLSIPFSSGRGSHEISHEETDEAKCLRELHFYVDGADGRVHASGFMRAQAAAIFPKNIHLIGTILGAVAEAVGRQPGTYCHFVTTLVAGR